MSRILIVEDELRIATLLARGLQKSGFLTAIAANGEQALQAVQTDSYDTILLDLELPITDGWTVLRTLRAEGSRCPVIVVTAFGNYYRQDVLAAGANDLVPKPFQFKELLAAIHKQIYHDPCQNYTRTQIFAGKKSLQRPRQLISY